MVPIRITLAGCSTRSVSALPSAPRSSAVPAGSPPMISMSSSSELLVMLLGCPTIAVLPRAGSAASASIFSRRPQLPGLTL